MLTREQVVALSQRLRSRATEPGVLQHWSEDFKAAADALDDVAQNMSEPAKEAAWPKAGKASKKE